MPTNKELFERIIQHQLETTRTLASIEEKMIILEKLDTTIDGLRDDLTEYKLITNRRISEHEITMAHIEEKVSNRTNLITLTGVTIAAIISFLIAWFTYR